MQRRLFTLIFPVVLVLALIYAGGAGAQEPKPARLAIPDAIALTSAERQIQQLLGKDLKSPAPEVRVAAAGKLLAQAEGAQSAAEQFAILRIARQTAASAGDAAGAFDALERTKTRFAVDESALRRETISALAKSIRELFDAEMTINEAMLLMAELVGADDYQAALSIANELRGLSEQMRTSDLAADFANESRRLRALAGEYNAVKQALAKLKTAPDDAAANALAGTFMCLRKQDYKSGLPMLAKGNDARLRALAAAELAADAGDATAALKVADAWWDYSQTSPEARKAPLLVHAGDWYAIAAPSVGGVRKLGVQERLSTAAKLREQAAPSTRARWVLLMRSDDAGIWNTPRGTRIDHNGFAADAAAIAPAETKYLRLRRLDNANYVILRMKKDEIHKNGAIWCGTAWLGYGAPHLGIENPKTQRVEKGLVDIDGNYQGWGFGHLIFPPRGVDAHAWSWAGETLGRTIFEIAVTDDEISPSERRGLLDLK
jgi:hypothetical protein